MYKNAVNEYLIYRKVLAENCWWLNSLAKIEKRRSK
jgi:hypothetical protein